MAGSPTALAKLGIGVADPVDTALNFSEFDPGVNRELYNANGTRGTFFYDANRMIENRTIVTPRLSTEPTAPELASLLPWALGGTPTGTTTKTYPWSNTPAARNVHFNPVAGEQWFLGGVGVDRMTIAAQVGGALSVDMDLVGQTVDATRSSFPALTYDQTLQPFLLTQLVLLVGGTSRAVNSFSFTVRGGIDQGRFLNSATLTTLLRTNPEGVYSFSFGVPSGDNASQFWASGISGASLNATFTNPSTGGTFVIDVAKIKFPGRSPSFPAREEGMISIEGQAVRTTTSDPVTITLNVGA